MTGGAAIHPQSYARTVFAALGGVVEIGAVNRTGTWDPAEASVGDFLAPRGEDIARIMAAVRTIGRFDDTVMAVSDELGYLREHPVTPEFLLLWSAGVAWDPGSSDDLAYLKDPRVVRRMCRMGADLQLARLLDALVTAGIAAGVAAMEGGILAAEIVRIACDLVEDAGRSTPEGVFRMWRVAELPDVLRPDSGAPESGKAGYRAFDAELERLLGPI
ncbi:hypothetical protein AB0M19_33595 [Streptomyces sp. NPDC051920]|uniref:hypothetical protein n=1 Tax=Streptomyces sp. NPDC051920 TaxID=3155523 RepID=UPI00344936D8